MKAFTSLLLLLGLLCGGVVTPASAARQPNIVIFLADDSGWGDYSVCGNTNLHTPNIDSIARGGASMDRFYVCAVCSPTRAEFLTGRYHARAGVRGGRVDWAERLLFSHWNGNVSARSQQYRYDSKGALFDLLADPGQRKDIAGEKPVLAAQMGQAVAQWRAEVLPKAKDDRPYSVGYAEMPRTPLPARDGVPHGGVKRSANAPNSSYFVNWRNLDDRMTWDIEVNTTGNYEVEILYTCPKADAGSTIELEFNGAKLAGKVTPGWDPPLHTNQDTLPRPAGESQMKEFHGLKLGVMRIVKGRGLLTLRALKIPGQSVMDVRQLNLTLRK